MIPVTPEFLDVVSGPHKAKRKLKVQVNGVIVDELVPVSGTVTVDSAQSIRRRCTFTIIDEEGKYTPQGAADLFNPTSGTLLIPETGVEHVGTEQIVIAVDTADQWNEGTLTDIAVNEDGSISIA
jgi:hypothetical protein